MTGIHRPLLRRITPVLALGTFACGAPDRPGASGTSRSFDVHPVPARDTVVRAPSTDTTSPIPFDTTDYFAATAGADPDSVVRGRLAGSAVVDSVNLGSGATAVLVRLGPEPHPNHGYFRVYVVEAGDGGRVARATQLEALGTVWPGRAAFGAADPDGDGRREPYLASWTGGRGGFTVSLYLLDRQARDGYGYDLSGAWTYLDSRTGEFLDPSRPPRPCGGGWRRRRSAWPTSRIPTRGTPWSSAARPCCGHGTATTARIWCGGRCASAGTPGARR